MLPRAQGPLTFEMHCALERADELHFKTAECIEELTSLPDHIQLMMDESPGMAFDRDRARSRLISTRSLVRFYESFNRDVTRELESAGEDPDPKWW